MSESEVPEPPDPPRWSSGGGPPGSLDLLSTLERVPVLPPSIRRTTPRNPRPLRPPWVRAFGAVTATALVIGGIVLWVLPRAEPAVAVGSEVVAPRLPASIPVLEMPVLPVAEVPASEAPAVIAPELVAPAGRREPARSHTPGLARREAVAAEPEETAAAPAPPSAPPCEPGGEGPRGRGRLVIQTLPWARLFVDGHDTGRNTPIREYSISAGCHRIELRASDGATHELTIDVADDERVRIVHRF